MKILQILKNKDFPEPFSTTKLDIRDFKVSANQTEYKVTYNGEDIHHENTNMELKSENVVKQLRNQLAEELKEARDSKDEGDVEDPAMKAHLDEITEGAKEMQAKPDIRAILREKGFVRGAIVSLEQGGYGVFTGEFYDCVGGTVGLHMTSGRSYHQSYCTLIDDVNKQVLRTVAAEKQRIMENAHQFCKDIDNSIDELIYG